MPTILQRINHRLTIKIERFLGLDFTSVIATEKLGLDKTLVSKGSPSGNKFLKKLLQDLAISDKDRFLDIGCSKGSAMRTTNKFPFERVDGLELSGKLAEIAKSNFVNTNVYNINATHFKRYNDYNFYYLYNPFPAVIMERVMQEINTQNTLNELKYIIYNNPVCEEVVLKSGFKNISRYVGKRNSFIFE
tara:strand:- start:137 stop:706 length:570 start_codon:yes stop_codon:yes gene_type:complete